jgi:glycosyltransferase involved in cell wall biosynthesis
MTPLKFSIITVVFNNEKTIADTVRSIAIQTYPNVEYLVIDGLSTDGTLQKLHQYSEVVTRVISEKDKGIYDAMNKGIALATGDIIGFINADDFYPSPDVLSTVATAFNSSGADSCFGDLCYVQQNDVSRIVRYWKSCTFKLGLFEKGWCPPHPTFFVRRAVYQRLGGFNLDYKIAADVELMARFLAAGRITSHYIPQVLVHMRLGGTTNRNLGNIVKQNLEIRRGLLAQGLRFSWLDFVWSKVLSRAFQFVQRPV